MAVNKITTPPTPQGQIDKINEIIDNLGGGGGGASRNIGEVVTSTIPLTDAGLHLLDGSLIQYGSYSAFVDYIANLYTIDPNASYFAKTSDVPFVNPVLTSNGTLGGDSFAVWSDVTMANLQDADVYGLFNPTVMFHSADNSTVGNIILYNPIALKVTNIMMENQNHSAAPNRASSAGTVYGSNDGTNWTSIKTYTNSVQEPFATWSIDLSNNTSYYKYYKINSTANGGAQWWCINEMTLTAFYQSTAEDWWQYQVATYGACGKFVYDSVNNTVRLPKLTGIIEGTTDLTALGDLIQAGLPNITGTFSGVEGDSASTGVFYRVGAGSIYSASGAGDDSTVGFDASRSSSIYGNSSTVQPQAINVLYYIVIATTTKTEIEVDIDEIATDLNGKADVDLTNITDSGYIKMAGAGRPSNTYEELVVGSTGATYTAPANGYYYWLITGGGLSYYGIANTSCSGMETGAVVTNKNYGLRLYMPCSKGDVIVILHQIAPASSTFRFVYAQGSESEAS